MENKTVPISCVIITLNEENNIKCCLESVKWADEIVVIDSGSTDKTLEICSDYKCKIYETPWLGFGKTKQMAVSKASNEWILAIDSDEELTPALQNEIQQLLSTEPDYKAYRIKRNSFYLGKLIKHCGWDKDYTLRLFNRNYANFNDKIVHEFVATTSPISQLSHPMLHHTYPSVSSHFAKMKRYSELGAEQLLKKGKKSSIFLAIMRGIFKWKKMYFLQCGFLDGKAGFLLSLNSAWGVYLKYLLLWEKNKSK